MGKRADTADNVAFPVLVLTQHPEDYAGNLRESGIEPIFAPNFGDFLDCLKDRTVCGFVLEVDEVLHSPALERVHLFQLSEVFPLLRVRRRKLDNALTYLDEPAEFVTRVSRFLPRPARIAPRAPVMLEALLADADDPLFSAPKPGTILDVSASGGLVNCEKAFGGDGVLRLRIAKLSDPAPITADVCWCMKHGRDHLRHCAGVRFREITPAQARELEERAMAGA
ncbi:MAG: PilZ domain-containing protein [Humidesulfovibrio sp.]|nr:PilZ domain-containing protein [Humidesulfovibrio sp.]